MKLLKNDVSATLFDMQSNNLGISRPDDTSFGMLGLKHIDSRNCGQSGLVQSQSTLGNGNSTLFIYAHFKITKIIQI